MKSIDGRFSAIFSTDERVNERPIEYPIRINAVSLNARGQCNEIPLKRLAIKIADIDPRSQGTGMDRNENTRPPAKAIKNAVKNELLRKLFFNAAPSK
jgi:hypothetical protein